MRIKLILIFFSLFSWLLIIKLATNNDLSFISREIIISFCLLIILGFHLKYVSIRLKLLMLIIIPLSFIGELIFSTVLGLYEYNIGRVPLYIPIGHAVVFGTAVEINQILGLRNFIFKNIRIIYFVYVTAFLFVIVYYRDTLSLLLGILMFITIYKKNKHTLYLVVGIIVLYLELVGTRFRCWTWKEHISLFTTTNPPLGSIFIYIGGDVLLNRIIRKFLNYRNRVKHISKSLPRN